MVVVEAVMVVGFVFVSMVVVGVVGVGFTFALLFEGCCC